jgi:hypothetical protein
MIKTCQYHKCGKEFESPKRNKIYCCQECMRACKNEVSNAKQLIRYRESSKERIARRGGKYMHEYRTQAADKAIASILLKKIGFSNKDEVSLLLA